MRITFIVVYTVVMAVVGLSSWVFGDALDRIRDRDFGVKSSELNADFTLNNTKSIFVYVFNDKTQLWDRAREETLKNATCDKLHTYVTGNAVGEK